MKDDSIVARQDHKGSHESQLLLSHNITITNSLILSCE